MRMIAGAIKHGNTDTLKYLLTLVPSPLPSVAIGDSSSDEFLHSTSKCTTGDALSCASALLAHGVDVDCLDQNGETALMCASYNGCLDLVKLFVSHDAGVDFATQDAGSALALATDAGQAHVVDYLISLGVSQSPNWPRGREPLTCAAERGHYAVFRALLDAGGVPRVQDYYSLYIEGQQSVLMLDDHYFGISQSPALLHGVLFPLPKRL